MSRRITARKTPEKAITEPTERSIPPDRMTKVIPTAVSPRKALSVRRLATTRDENIAGYCQPETR
ncbi:MAG: hypothetical protein R3D59_14235 [Paracoccaceae bacterium]